MRLGGRSACPAAVRCPHGLLSRLDGSLPAEAPQPPWPKPQRARRPPSSGPWRSRCSRTVMILPHFYAPVWTADASQVPSATVNASHLIGSRANDGLQDSVLHTARSASVGTAFVIIAGVCSGVPRLAGDRRGSTRLPLRSSVHWLLSGPHRPCPFGTAFLCYCIVLPLLGGLRHRPAVDPVGPLPCPLPPALAALLRHGLAPTARPAAAGLAASAAPCPPLDRLAGPPAYPVRALQRRPGGRSPRLTSPAAPTPCRADPA